MTTSAITTFDLTARQVVTRAMRLMGVLPSDENPTAIDMTFGIEELNVLLKSWQINGPDLWRQTEGSLTLTANTASFSLATTPHRVIDCRLRRNGIDLPMELLTRQEYFEMPLKTATGVPTQYYPDVERYGITLYIWPLLASVSGETIEYTYQRRYFDVTSADQTLDLPQEYLGIISTNLAAAMAPAFGVDDGKLTERGMMMLAQAQSADREPVVRFSPDMR